MRTGTLFTERGTIVTVFIVCYALTSFVAGYIRCEVSSKIPLPGSALHTEIHLPLSQCC